MNIATRLSGHISSRGFAAEVARRANVGRDTVVRIATGKTPNPGIETVKAIERALDDLFPTPGQGSPCELTGSSAPGKEGA